MYLIRDHIFFLKKAYEEALKAFKNNEVPIGAIIVKDNKIIGKGYNQRIIKRNSLYHAEIVAINDACKTINNWRLDGATIYITLEPCLMCLGAIMQSRIKKIIFGALDTKGGAISNCKDRIDKFPFNIDILYIPSSECSNIIKEFFKKKRERKKLTI